MSAIWDISEVLWPLPPKAGTQNKSASAMCIFWQLVAQGYFPRETVKHKRKACDRLLSILEMHAESEKEGEGERER